MRSTRLLGFLLRDLCFALRSGALFQPATISPKFSDERRRSTRRRPGSPVQSTLVGLHGWRASSDPFSHRNLPSQPFDWPLSSPERARLRSFPQTSLAEPLLPLFRSDAPDMSQPDQQPSEVPGVQAQPVVAVDTSVLVGILQEMRDQRADHAAEMQLLRQQMA